MSDSSPNSQEKPLCVYCGKPVEEPIVYRNDPDGSPAVAMIGDRWGHMACHIEDRNRLFQQLTHPPVITPVETAWLIECVAERPLWICDDHDNPRQFGWTADANEAIRFCRESDAQSVIACANLGRGILMGGKRLMVSATEHEWMDAPVRQDAPGPENKEKK